MKIETIKSRIDTIQTVDKTTNREEIVVEVKGYKVLKIDERGKIKGKFNPNNIHYTYSTDYKLSLTKESLKEMFEMVTIIDNDEVKMNRVDIATDIDIDFTENIKILDLLHRCLIANFKSGKGWDTVDKKDSKRSNLRFANRDFNIEFYDKKKESDNTSLYDTRLEIRALRVKSQSFEYHIEKCIDLYKATSGNITKVEKAMIELLLDLWKEEKEEEPKLRFATFVRIYKHYFYTMNILKEVYKKVGLKGALNGWLRDYRNTHKLDLYTKKDIENMCKNIVKSLKEYKKS